MAATFDADMKARLVAFQQAHGLVADGTVGAKTWARLAPAGVPALSADDYPTLAKITRLEPTKEAIKAFLLEECGLDIDAVLAEMPTS